MNLNETKLIKLSLDSSKEERRLFRKYRFSRILSNTVTLDTITCISKSTLTFIIDLIPFDLKWIKWVFVWLRIVNERSVKVHLCRFKMNSNEFIHSFPAQEQWRANPKLLPSFFFHFVHQLIRFEVVLEKIDSVSSSPSSCLHS